jgi:LysM repeat protein
MNLWYKLIPLAHLLQVDQRLICLRTKGDIPMTRTPFHTHPTIRVISLMGLIILALVFTSTVATLPRLAAVQAADNCASKHTVVAGDTLSSLALKYGTTVTEIANANNLKDPYTIFIGQVLCIPASTSTGATGTPAPGATPPSSSKLPYFTAAFTGNKVVITTYNYPKFHNYLATASFSWLPFNYHLGWLNTQKLSSVEMTYALPRALRDLNYYTVCLKNAVNDDVQCNSYRNIKGEYYLTYTWSIAQSDR